MFNIHITGQTRPDLKLGRESDFWALNLVHTFQNILQIYASIFKMFDPDYTGNRALLILVPCCCLPGVTSQMTVLFLLLTGINFMVY
jgi:hypothetical protein